MAGGSGTRLWPLSRKATPKQFQKLIGDRSLLQQTYNRIKTVIPAGRIWIMTGEQYTDIIREQLGDLPTNRIITEPSARNTAAASSLALLTILKEDPEAIIGIMASDHYIDKEKVFTDVIEKAYSFIEKEPSSMVAIGIHPSSANTGYGYIKFNKKITSMGSRSIFAVDSFHEKPDQATAEEYFESGQYLWNASYFTFNAQQMKNDFQKYAPDIFGKLVEYLAEPSDKLYNIIPKESFDKAIAERLTNLVVIPAEMGWSDVGDWATLHDILAGRGEASQVATSNHISNNSENTLVMAGNKLIATVGLKDVVIIDTEDVILVCHKNAVQNVKKIVEQLQNEGRGEYL